MKKQYTRKQIQEAISYWKKQLAEGNYRKVNEAAGFSIENPYSIDNCKAIGYVAYFTLNDDPFLPVNYSLPLNVDDTDEDTIAFSKEIASMRNRAAGLGSKTAVIDLKDRYNGKIASGTFFSTREQCDNAMEISEIDAGGAQTNDYLYDCVEAGLINEQERSSLMREFEANGLSIYDTYVCGDDTVFFGKDACVDSAIEWERKYDRW